MNENNRSSYLYEVWLFFTKEIRCASGEYISSMLGRNISSIGHLKHRFIIYHKRKLKRVVLKTCSSLKLTAKNEF